MSFSDSASTMTLDVIPDQVDIIISSNLGGGADSFIAATDPNTNFGANPSLLVKSDPNPFIRKTYLKFDLSTVTFGLANAELDLIYEGTNLSAPFSTYNVYGINDGVSGEDWNESSITFNNAPGNQSGIGVNTDVTTFLGNFSFNPNTTPSGTVITFSDPRLTDFLSADSNNIVSLIVTRATLDDSTQSFAAKENPTLDPPRLRLDIVNDPPVAADDNYSVDEDNILTVDDATGVLANDSDIEGDELSVTLASNVSNGALTLNSDGSFEYTPDANFFGTDTFTYEVSDGKGGTDTGTVALTINPVNDTPVAADDNYSVDEDDTLLTGNVLTNDSDPDGDPLIVSAVNGNAADVDTQINLDSGAKLTLNEDGTFSYDPDDLDDDDGTTDSFNYTVSDGNGGSDTATVTVTVTDDDGDDLFSGGEDELLSGLGNNNYAEILSFDSLDESVLYGSSSEYNLEKTNSGNGIFNDRDLISLVQDDIITDLEKDSSLSLF